MVRQGGSTSLTSGTEENKIYNELIKLEKEKKFADIIVLCDKSIKESPKWYTSYFYKAIALYNLSKNNKQKAIELLEYVVKNTYGDPQYSLSISNIYSQLGEKSKSDELFNSIPKEIIQDLINAQKRQEQRKK